MAQHWEDIDGFAVEVATLDLERCGAVEPLLVAYRGDEELFFAWLRPFAKGEYADPMIELLSLAMPLDADRLAFAAAGRVTSLDDPIPPVVPGADLRQRTLAVEYADGAGRPVRQYSVLHPFELLSGRVIWKDAVRLDDGQGWIHGALGAAVGRRGQMVAGATDADIRAQAERCAGLGHDLYLGVQVCERLGLQPELR